MGSGNIVAPSLRPVPRAAQSGLRAHVRHRPRHDRDHRRAQQPSAIAFIGSHLGENMHNTAVQDVSQANAAGATFIAVDPRFSIIASKSKYWLPIKPGTDTALLLAWAHVLITEGLYQKDFIARNAIGFDELAKHVADKTPEWAYLETGIEPARHPRHRPRARHARARRPRPPGPPRRLVRQRHAALARRRHRQRAARQLGQARAASTCPRRMKLADYPTPAFPHKALYKPRQKFPFATRALRLRRLRRQSPRSRPPATVKAWIVYGCNVPLTLPNTAEDRSRR